MILDLGKVSSSIFKEAGRRMLRGTTVPGKTTIPRTGKMESVSGMVSSADFSFFVTAMTWGEDLAPESLPLKDGKLDLMVESSLSSEGEVNPK